MVLVVEVPLFIPGGGGNPLTDDGCCCCCCWPSSESGGIASVPLLLLMLLVLVIVVASLLRNLRNPESSWEGLVDRKISILSPRIRGVVGEVLVVMGMGLLLVVLLVLEEDTMG